MSADSKLDVFPGEKALSSEVLEWTRVNKPRLSADHRALAEGYQPRSLIAYRAAPIPAELTAGGDVTASMVANRDVLRQTRTDDNVKLELQRAAHSAEIRNSFFEVIAEALSPKASLFLRGLRERHKQAPPFAGYHDGAPA